MNELLEDVIKTNKKVRDMVEQQRTDLYSKIKRDNIIFTNCYAARRWCGTDC